MKTVIVLNNDQMGHGDSALGQKILATLLRKLPAVAGVTAIVLYNSGVKLITKGSPVLTELAQLHERGIDLRPCGTCPELTTSSTRTRAATNMDEILRELAAAEKVITL